MNQNTHLEHLVLKIKSDTQSSIFYQDFLALLGYKVDFESKNYVNFNNGILPIGLYFESNFNENQENSAGLGHLAWKTDNLELVHQLNELIAKHDLEYESLGEKRTHHNQEFFTYCFYCPSGNRLELIYNIN